MSASCRKNLRDSSTDILVCHSTCSNAFNEFWQRCRFVREAVQHLLDTCWTCIDFGAMYSDVMSEIGECVQVVRDVGEEIATEAREQVRLSCAVELVSVYT